MVETVMSSVVFYLSRAEEAHHTRQEHICKHRRANGIFVGFADGHADGAYKVLNPETGKVYVRRFDDVTVDRPGNQYRHQSFAACAEDDCKDFDSFTWDDSGSDEEAESKSGQSHAGDCEDEQGEIRSNKDKNESDASASDSEDEQGENRPNKKTPETESSGSDSSESESEEGESEAAMSESESGADLVETDDEVMQQFSTQDYDEISSDDEDGRQHRSGHY